MRRVTRLGLGAGLVTGLGAAAVKVRRRIAARREERHARADEARRNLWPPVPVKPGAEARIQADHAGPGAADHPLAASRPNEHAPRGDIAEPAG